MKHGTNRYSMYVCRLKKCCKTKKFENMVSSEQKELLQGAFHHTGLKRTGRHQFFKRQAEKDVEKTKQSYFHAIFILKRRKISLDSRMFVNKR